MNWGCGPLYDDSARSVQSYSHKDRLVFVSASSSFGRKRHFPLGAIPIMGGTLGFSRLLFSTGIAETKPVKLEGASLLEYRQRSILTRSGCHEAPVCTGPLSPRCRRADMRVVPGQPGKTQTRRTAVPQIADIFTRCSMLS